MCYLSNSHHLEFHPVITETWSPVPIRVTLHQPLIHTQCQKHLPQIHSSPITHSIASSVHPRISSQTCTQWKCSYWRKLLLNTIFWKWSLPYPRHSPSPHMYLYVLKWQLCWGALSGGRKLLKKIVWRWWRVYVCLCVKEQKRVCDLLPWPSYSLGNKKKN